MPKTDIDYSNTIIYKITCKDHLVTDVYVGHTTNFVQRKHAHKQCCNNEKSSNGTCRLYKIMRENGGWSNWNMEIINFFNCKDHYEARLKEQEYYILLHANLNSNEPLPTYKQTNKEYIKPHYHCNTCEVSFQSEQLMNIHNQTKKHLKKIADSNIHKIVCNLSSDIHNATSSTNYALSLCYKYICENCNYKTNKKSSFDNHTLSHRHFVNQQKKQRAINIEKANTCDHCGKSFKDRSGHWRHKKICSQNKTQDVNTNNDSITSVVVELIKQNKEFKDLIIFQNQDFKELILDQNNKMMEITSKCSTTTNNNVISNSNNNINNKFNLNVFLNEKCKDAMNIGDFVNSLQLQLKDLENTGEYGFAEGISRIFTRGLKELDVYKRPIHCSDLKREILHMKSDGQWEKTSGESPKLIRAIKQVANKNISMISEWKKENPGCEKYNSRKNDTYLKLTIESMGPTEQKEEERDFGKIIRSIAKDTTIEKES